MLKDAMDMILKKWIKTYKNSLLPPVCNKVIWADETFIVMLVGGPNVRKDFHINKIRYNTY